jgi:AAA15 family ATPase/GTPase
VITELGKHLCLEAIFLAAARGPENGVQFRGLRGLEISPTIAHTEAYRAVWADMFYRYDPSRKIKISLRGSGNDSRSVTVFYNTDQQITLPLTPRDDVPSQSGYVPVTFHWTSPGRPDVIITPISSPGGMQTPPTPPSNIDGVYISTHASISAKQIADFYSALSKQNKESIFVEALKEQFPQIKTVSIETEAGTNTLFVSLPWIDRKVPLTLVSHGANSLAALLISIAQVSKGIACVDEIESGLYHSRFDKMWSQVAAFVETYECQIFASTHSQECLDAAARALNPESVALIQTSRTNGRLAARVVSGDELIPAIKHGLEVRGKE